MQVQYRETKAGYDCIHLPSIDLNALTEAQAQRYHQRADGTTKRSIVRKASKLTFSSNKGKEKEHEAAATTEKDREREAPGRPSATASSGSSSFFNVPTSVTTAQSQVPERPPSATGVDWSPSPPQAESSNPSLLHEDHRPRSPSKPKFLPPIPRDFALPPTKETSRPTLGEPEKDPFDPANQNGLAVRFEINIVKVWILAFSV
jgi:serine/threonine protein kinase KIN1/2